MNNRGLSREGLKTVACTAMLIDHIGAVLVMELLRRLESYSAELYLCYCILRCIGRTAFPIFCFQLVEGAFHTRDPKKYALRLAIGAVLAEIPFDLAFFGELTWKHSNVMITLLLGFGMIRGMMATKDIRKVLVIIPFYLAAKILHTDYAGKGILLIALFALTRGMRYEKLLQFAGMVLLGNNAAYYIGKLPIYVDRCKLLALLPVFAYNGRKVSQSKTVQWGFYLFYPVHILVLYLLKNVLFG